MTDVSDTSFKDKYHKVYENYLTNIVSVPGFKNRSSGVKAALSFGPSHNGYSYQLSDDSMPPILLVESKRNRNHEIPPDQAKSAKLK
jgi:hypothetical protein